MSYALPCLARLRAEACGMVAVGVQAMAVAAIAVAQKLHNFPMALSDVAQVAMNEAIQMMNQPTFSTELSIAYSKLKEQHDKRSPASLNLYEVR